MPNQACQRATNVRYWVLGCLCLAAGVAYFDRQLMAVVAQPLGRELALSDSQLGAVMASFFLGYAAFQIPSGWLADRWGPRFCLTLFALAWSLATGAVALAYDYSSLLALWFVAGSAQAGIFPCAARSIRGWLPDSRRALASGMLASCMSLGGALSALVAGGLVDRLDWRVLFAMFAVPGIAWAMAFGWWYRDDPREHRGVNPAELDLLSATSRLPGGPLDSAGVSIWWAMWRSRTMWAICGQQFFRAAAYIFFATWFPTYLAEARGMSLSAAGQLTSLPLLAVVVGSPLGGGLSDWLWVRSGSARLSRCVLAASCMSACAVLIVFAYFVTSATAAVAIISLGAFFAALGGASSYAITMDLGGNRVATVFSVMNMAGNAGAAAFPPLVAWLVDATGRWNEILLMFAGIYVAAAVCWLLVDPNRPLFPIAHTSDADRPEKR